MSTIAHRHENDASRMRPRVLQRPHRFALLWTEESINGGRDGGAVVYSNRHSGWEFPDEAGYPDGVGTLDQGRRELVTEVRSWRVGCAHPRLTSDYPLEFGSDDADSKYEAYLDGQTIATLTYRRLQRGRRVALLSTVV